MPLSEYETCIKTRGDKIEILYKPKVKKNEKDMKCLMSELNDKIEHIENKLELLSQHTKSNLEYKNENINMIMDKIEFIQEENNNLSNLLNLYDTSLRRKIEHLQDNFGSNIEKLNTYNQEQRKESIEFFAFFDKVNDKEKEIEDKLKKFESLSTEMKTLKQKCSLLTKSILEIKNREESQEDEKLDLKNKINSIYKVTQTYNELYASLRRNVETIQDIPKEEKLLDRKMDNLLNVEDGSFSLEVQLKKHVENMSNHLKDIDNLKNKMYNLEVTLKETTDKTLHLSQEWKHEFKNIKMDIHTIREEDIKKIVEDFTAIKKKMMETGISTHKKYNSVREKIDTLEKKIENSDMMNDIWKKQQDKIHSKVIELRSNQENTKGDIVKIKKETKNIKDNIGLVKQSLDNVSLDMHSKIEEQKTQLLRYNNDVEKLDNRVKNNEIKYDTSLNQVKTSIKETNVFQDNILKRMEKLETDYDEMIKNWDTIEHRYLSVCKRVQNIEDTKESKNVEEDMIWIKREVRELCHTYFSELKERFLNITGEKEKSEMVYKDVEKIKFELSYFKEKMKEYSQEREKRDNVDTNVVHSEMDKLKIEIKDINTTLFKRDVSLNTLYSNVNALEERVQTISDKIKVFLLSDLDKESRDDSGSKELIDLLSNKVKEIKNELNKLRENNDNDLNKGNEYYDVNRRGEINVEHIHKKMEELKDISNRLENKMNRMRETIMKNKRDIEEWEIKWNNFEDVISERYSTLSNNYLLLTNEILELKNNYKNEFDALESSILKTIDEKEIEREDETTLDRVKSMLKLLEENNVNVKTRVSELSSKVHKYETLKSGVDDDVMDIVNEIKRDFERFKNDDIKKYQFIEKDIQSLKESVENLQHSLQIDIPKHIKDAYKEDTSNKKKNRFNLLFRKQKTISEDVTNVPLHSDYGGREKDIENIHYLLKEITKDINSLKSDKSLNTEQITFMIKYNLDKFKKELNNEIDNPYDNFATKEEKLMEVERRLKNEEASIEVINKEGNMKVENRMDTKDLNTSDKYKHLEEQNSILMKEIEYMKSEFKKLNRTISLLTLN